MLGRSKHSESHNAYGALVNHKAVCDGFASVYTLIAQYFGMKCMVVDGKSSYNRAAKVEHAWNYRKTPKCSSDKLSYFILNGLYAYSETQVEELLCKKMKQRADVIRIKISPGISLPGDGIKFLEGKMMSAASRAGLSCAFNYTWQENNRYLIVILNR